MADEDVTEQEALEPAPPPKDPPEPGKPPPDPEAWMLSFGDLVSLMLVFFVMLFSMATLEKEEFEAIVSALAQQFNPSAQSEQSKPSADLDIPKVTSTQAYNLSYLRALIEDKLAGDPILEDIRMHALHDRIVVSLPTDRLFETGVAVLQEGAADSIERLGTVVRFLENRVDINGHTDPEPSTAPGFPSNWELSLARAMAVANLLRRAGFVKSLYAFGFADSRFNEISLDLAVEERYRLARRVDIVIRKDERKEGAL
jgi:chemotaxis protein MotB